MIRIIDPSNPDPEIIKEGASLVNESKLIILPTDTAYMLAVNALDRKAIKKIFEFKNRPLSNPIHVVVSSIKEAEKYVFLNENAKLLAKEFLPGPLTLVLQKKEIIPDILTANLKTLGIRIPNNKICLMLAKESGVPLTATSANLTTKEATYSVAEIKEQFGKKISEVDLILDAGELPRTPVSTIVDLTGDVKILREGPISVKDIMQKLLKK